MQASHSAWFRSALAALGDVPDSVVIDIETNGLNVKDHYVVPVELGWATIRDHVVTASGSVLLDWRRFNNSFGQMVEDQLAQVRYQMEVAGNAHHITTPRLHAEGEDPKAALLAFNELINDSVNAGEFLIGFNVVNFDLRVLARCFDMFDSMPMSDRISEATRDCGMFELAILAGIAPPFAPSQLSAWYGNVRKHSGKHRWSLPRHALPLRGIEHDPLKMHAAAEDARLTGELYLAQRLLSNPHNGT